MKKTILTIALAIICSITSYAQWSMGPIFSTPNSIIGGLTNIASPFLMKSGFFSPWYYPTCELRFFGNNKFKNAAGDIDFERHNWDFSSFAVGYRIGCMPSNSPIGFDFTCNYVKESHYLKIDGATGYNHFFKTMINPTLLLQGRIGDFYSNTINPMIMAGVGYDYALTCGHSYTDINSVNNGMTSYYGAGIEIPQAGMVIEIKFSHNHYDYFNNEFSPDGTTKPFADITNSRNSLIIGMKFYLHEKSF